MCMGGGGSTHTPSAAENQNNIDKTNLTPEAYQSKYKDRVRTYLGSEPAAPDSSLQNGSTYLG